MNESDQRLKAEIVALIILKRTEEAIQLLSQIHKVDTPKLKVGHVKGKKKAAGVYNHKNKTILVSKGQNLWEPFIILHEFYHHLRSESGEHRGNEKLADAFARDYIIAFNKQKLSI